MTNSTPISGPSRNSDDRVSLRTTRPSLLHCSCRGRAAPSLHRLLNTINLRGTSNNTRSGDHHNRSLHQVGQHAPTTKSSNTITQSSRFRQDDPPRLEGIDDSNDTRLGQWLSRLHLRMLARVRFKGPRTLSQLDKARLQHWLLRNASRAWIIRAIVYQVNSRLALAPDLVSLLRRGAFSLRELDLECPPLHRLLRLPAQFRPSRKLRWRNPHSLSAPARAHFGPRARQIYAGIGNPPVRRIRAKRVVKLPRAGALIGLRRRVRFKSAHCSSTAYSEFPIGNPSSGLICRISHGACDPRFASFDELASRIAKRRTLLQRPIAIVSPYSEYTCLRISRSVGSDPPVILHRQWWHSGQNALGRERSACEEGDHVASTRRSASTPADEAVKDVSRAVPIRGLAHLKKKQLCVKRSLLPDAGYGLFATRDICTYATNIKTKSQQARFAICPYVGEQPSERPSDYVMRVGDVIVDAWKVASCWARYANDALDVLMDNVMAMLIDGVIWLVPLPGVEILTHHELYLAYDWEYWYRKWEACEPHLRARIINRYPVSSSAPRISTPPKLDELAEARRVAEFWFKKWSWWSPDMRRAILRTFKDFDRTDYRVDAPTDEFNDGGDSDGDEPPDGACEGEPAPVHPDQADLEDRRRHDDVPILPMEPTERLPAPRMRGPAAAPDTNQLPQSDVAQSDRPLAVVARRNSDPNSNRPIHAHVMKPLVLWAAEPRRRNKVPTNMYSEVSSQHWTRFCKIMDTWKTPGDDLVATIPMSADIRVGYLNVNRLEDHKFDYLMWFYEDKRLDILFLIDTRLSVLGGQFANAKIKERLGNDILVLQSKTRPEVGSGGQLAIVRPHLRKHLVTEETDPANLGILFALTFQHGLRKLAVISVYWPCATQGEGALRTRLAQYMAGTERRGTITDYCKHLVQNVLDRTMEDALNTCIVGGDWNANWQDSRNCPRRSHRGIAGWAREIGLAEAHQPLIAQRFNTRFPSPLDADHEATAIDHVLTTYAACTVTEAGISNAPTWSAVSDHRPLWIAARLGLTLSMPRAKRRVISKIRRVELDRKDEFACEEFRAHLRILLLAQPAGDRTGEDLGDWIESICASSVNIVRAHMKPAPKSSRRRRDGWTATYHVQMKMHDTFLKIRQFLTGQGGRAQWEQWYAPTGVKKEIDKLCMFAARELRDPENRDKVMMSTRRDPAIWRTTLPTELDMTTEMRAILKKMHGRRRSENRMKFKSARRNREQARQEHKYARWIRALVGKQRIPFDMDKLTHLDGTVECDPEQIHEILTAWFGKWFAADRDRSGSFHHEQRWTEFLNDRPAFDDLLKDVAVDDWVKDALWVSAQATASKLSQDMKDELADQLNQPPSYAEFVERLRKPRGGPTAGLTGLTYNMMAEWPDEIAKSIYEALCKLELEQSVPLFWKNKALIPMPKAHDPTLEQLRPLMLIEVLRKAWCGFSVSKVWAFLEKHQVLEDIQFAYRRNREAGVAQLCMRNSIEEAQETESAILLGSYDKYHAFDSLSRSVMKLSFSIVGLGGPEASRLVDMEEDSHVTVLTPLAKHHWAERYTRTLHRGDLASAEPAFFIPAQGTPQGDTISCLTWTVFENICLAALRSDPGRVKLYIRGADGLIYEAADLCYADDLNTISPTLAGMQRKADIIGGFAEILHLRISVKKLRQIAADFGPQGLLPPRCDLRVNDGTGRIETLMIPPRGPFDQLGYRYSVGTYPRNQRPDLDQFLKLKAMLTAVCRSLARKSATAGCKLDALEMSVYNTVLWRAQCAPWTLAMCQELDRPINQLLRHITKNLPGFATLLLYAKAPGLNFLRVADQMQIRKLSLGQRGLTNPPCVAAGPQGLVERGARFYGLATIPGTRATIGPSDRHHWGGSLLQRLRQCSLYLTTGGRDATGTNDEQICSHANQAAHLTRAQVAKLTSLSVHTYGDITEQSETSTRWTDTGLLGINFLDGVLETRVPEHRSNPLRAGSCWLACDGSILEFLGTLAVPDGPPLMFRRWLGLMGTHIGAILQLAGDTPSLGAGSDLFLTYSEVWPCTTSTRVILEADDSVPRLDKAIKRKVVRKFSQLRPALGPHVPRSESPAERIVEWLKVIGLEEDAYEMFTDGGWKDHTPWLTHCFHGSDAKSTRASASIVFLHKGADRWTRPGLIVHIAPTDSLHLSSGYPAELTALLCASQVALLWKPSAIVTDCESAFGLIKKGFVPRAEQKRDHATLARLLVRYSRILKPTLYRHTYAHLDRYLPPHLHTDDQRGNILADRSAGLKLEDATWIATHYPQLTRRAFSMQDIHSALINDIPLCVTNGVTPTLPSLHNTFNKENFAQYIKNRLSKTSHGALFRDASYHFCTEVFELSKGDIAQRASRVRLIFDKVWQPWNTQKYKLLAPPICPHCDVVDSMDHMLRDCKQAAVAALRSEALVTARRIVAEGDALMHAVFDSMLEVIKEPHGASILRGLWLPQHIESLRSKLYISGHVPLDKTEIAWDSPKSKAVHSAVLDIAKVLGQASVNIMRERNAQTQDALNPTRAQQAGKLFPPPLELYDCQKKFKKTKAKPKVPARITTRMMSLHPKFVPEKRKHPRVLAQEYNRERELVAEAARTASIAAMRARAAEVYAELIVALPRVPRTWDPEVYPYDVVPEHPPAPAGDNNYAATLKWWYIDRWRRARQNQLERAEIYEAWVRNENRRQAREQDAIEDQLYRQSAEYMEMIRWRDMPRRRKFTRELVAAREEWSRMCAERGQQDARTQSLQPCRVPPAPKTTPVSCQPSSDNSALPHSRSPPMSTTRSLSSIAAARSSKRATVPTLRTAPSTAPRRPSAFDIAEALTIGTRTSSPLASPKKLYRPGYVHVAQSAEEEVEDARLMREAIRKRPNRFSRAAIEARNPSPHRSGVPRSTDTSAKYNLSARSELPPPDARSAHMTHDARSPSRTVDARHQPTAAEAADDTSLPSLPAGITITPFEITAPLDPPPPEPTVSAEVLTQSFAGNTRPLHVFSPLLPRDEGHYPLLTDHG